MIKLLQIYLISFILLFALTFGVSLFIYSINKALLLALIIGLLYGLFAVGFSIRVLKQVNFIIDSSNKAKDKGLSWYLERIERQAKDLRFVQSHNEHGKITYKAQSLYQVFESDIKIEYSPYDIHISCSRMMMRIILDYLDLDYETVKQ